MNTATLPLRSLKYKVPLIDSVSEDVFICGGAVRDAILGTPFEDIDIFGISEKRLNEFALQNLKTFDLVYNAPELKTYVNGNLKVQLIYRITGTAQELIDQFDYTICQFAANNSEIICNPESLIHLYEKKLVVHKLNPIYVASSVERMQKYIKKGYSICSGGIKDILTTVRSATEEQIEENFDFYPDGRSRTVRFD